MGEDLLAAHRKTDCETDSCSLMGRKKQTNKKKTIFRKETTEFKAQLHKGVRHTHHSPVTPGSRAPHGRTA